MSIQKRAGLEDVASYLKLMAVESKARVAGRDALVAQCRKARQAIFAPRARAAKRHMSDRERRAVVAAMCAATELERRHPQSRIQQYFPGFTAVHAWKRGPRETALQLDSAASRLRHSILRSWR